MRVAWGVAFILGVHLSACATGDKISQTTSDPFVTDGGNQDAATPMPTSTVPTMPTTTSSTGGTGGTGPIPQTGGSGGEPVTPPCSDGLKRCAGICVQPTPVLGCSLTDCTPCEDPNGVASCDGEMCVITCNDGYTLENGTCTAPVSCTNNILDGSETDVDCGGMECPPCTTGKACTQDGDCKQGPCVDNACTCEPDTCDSASGCGAGVDDGCGGTIDCSDTCPGGEVCFQSTCCQPITSCSQGMCGTTDDGCGGTVDCGGCQNGVCVNGTCCTPLTPQTCGADQCGTTPDGCGGTVDCGTDCGSGKVCHNNACCTPSSCTLSGCGYQDDGCGGSACALCGSGGCCDNNNDCQSGNCRAGFGFNCGFLITSSCG